MLGLLRLALALALALAAAGSLAEAAWLVTDDGTKIETRGPWQVRDGLVVFTTADGVLASMRVSKCDLEASREATAAAALAATRQEPSPPPPPPRRPVLVLTDADVGHVSPEPVPDEQEVPEEPEAAAPAPAGSVAVSGWQPKDEENGVSLTGMVSNDSANVAGNIRLVAVFRDADGDPIEKRPAVLSASTLAPGQKAQFKVPAFGLFAYSSVDFDLQHFEILSGRDDAGAATEDGE